MAIFSTKSARTSGSMPVSFKSFGALGPTVGLAMLFEHQDPNAEIGWPLAAARAAAVALTWMMTVAVGWRHGGWREALRRGDRDQGRWTLQGAERT